MILFAVDCSASMHKLYNDARYEDGVKTSNMMMALESAMQIQKKKVLVGPNDSVGVLFYNTVRIILVSLTRFRKSILMELNLT